MHKALLQYALFAFQTEVHIFNSECIVECRGGLTARESSIEDWSCNFNNVTNHIIFSPILIFAIDKVLCSTPPR